MKLRNLRSFAVLATVLSLSAIGCSGQSQTDDATDDELNTSSENCGGGYCVDMAKLNKMFGATGADKITKLRDAFTVKVDLGGGNSVVAQTHIFPKPDSPIKIVPYGDGDDFKDASGRKVRGDEAVAKLYKPGEIGFAVKHHRPLHRTLQLGQGGDMKEDFKLWDTHIEIVMGVKKGDHDGVITVNSPQNYMEGGFGYEDPENPGDYPMVFAKPVLPSYLSAAVKQAFIDNIRTMAVGFDAVIEFPGDYNGGDPLGARDPKRVREHVRNMIKANAGNQAAKAYFQKPENQVYCAELAFLSSSAGLHVPLNDEGIKLINSEAASDADKVSDEEWTQFKAQVALQNKHAAEPSVFVTSNANTNIHYIDLANLDSAAMKNLKPVYEYAGAQRDVEAKKLSLSPMTMADIVANFMRTHFPREQQGEAMAPVMAKVLQAIEPGLLESMNFDDAHKPTDPAQLAVWTASRAKVDDLYKQIVVAVGKQYPSYAAFRAALDPLLAASRQITGPRGDTGEGLFTPPSLFHTVLQGEHLGGLMTLDYVGHGLHVTVTKPGGS
jgi:hypothetical protein